MVLPAVSFRELLYIRSAWVAVHSMRAGLLRLSHIPSDSPRRRPSGLLAKEHATTAQVHESIPLWLADPDHSLATTNNCRYRHSNCIQPRPPNYELGLAFNVTRTLRHRNVVDNVARK